MEVPEEVKKLYRHWAIYLKDAGPKKKPGEVFSDISYFENMAAFIKERMSVLEKKSEGKPGPWTIDPVISKYRFCNIYREFDRQTIEIHSMLNALRDDFPLWLLNIFYARMVARPETLRQVGLLSFDKIRNRELKERLLSLQRPKYGTPYVFPISVIQRSDYSTREKFIAEFLPSRMETVAKAISGWRKLSVLDGLRIIKPIFGFNLDFLWTEVLIDTAYQFPEKLDLFQKFPIGPGAKPTFSKIKPGADLSSLAEELSKINFNAGLTLNGRLMRLSAENWEGIGCEFRKYTNLSQGEGRRRIYRGHP